MRPDILMQNLLDIIPKKIITFATDLSKEIELLITTINDQDLVVFGAQHFRHLTRTCEIVLKQQRTLDFDIQATIMQPEGPHIAVFFVWLENLKGIIKGKI